MIPGGLKPDGFKALLQALRDGTRVTTTVSARALSDGTLLTVVQDDQIIDDQIDFAQEKHRADRTWSAGIDDPLHELGLDTAALSGGFGGLGVMFQPYRHVWVDSLGVWVTIPQGGYRPSAVKRDGSVLTIEAPDKSSLWLAPRLPSTVPANTNLFAAIRSVLRDLGERNFAFPPDSATKARTGSKPQAIGGKDDSLSYWDVLVNLAASYGWQLFYDEYARPAIRRIPGERAVPVARFDKSNMVSAPASSADLSLLRNYVKATGAGSGTAQARSTARLNNGHPLSAQTLNVNGVSQYIVDFEERSNLSQSELDSWTDARIVKVATQTVDVSCEVFPIWHVTPLDRVQVVWEGVTYLVPLREASIPGGGGGSMSIGFRKTVRKPSAGRIGKARVAA